MSIACFLPACLAADNQGFEQQLHAFFADTHVQKFFEPEAKRQAVSSSALATVKSHPLDDFDFYKDYLAKYYPKVFVIRERFFIAMTPEQVSVALQDIVNVFTEKPWFYFVNQPEGFKITYYWEYILDQLSFISEFLNKARVNEKDLTISLSDDSDDDFLSFLFSKTPRTGSKNLPTLYDYLAEKNKKILYDFYALCFDYLIKLFNEGILLQELRQARRYHDELEKVSEKLKNSLYEAEYNEHFKTAGELLELLKQKIDDEDTFFSSRKKRRTLW